MCLERRAVMAILCSLVNTVTSFDPVGYGIPYSSMLFSDTKEVLVTISSQCLISLLDSTCGVEVEASPISSKGKTVERRESVSSTGTTGNGGNRYQNYIARIHRPEDLELIIESFSKLMSDPMESKTTYLPGSRKKSEVFVEVLMLLWKFLDYNEVNHSLLTMILEIREDGVQGSKSSNDRLDLSLLYPRGEN